MSARFPEHPERRAAVVTGASSGIGQATAELLADMKRKGGMMTTRKGYFHERPPAAMNVSNSARARLPEPPLQSW